jgi:hypothetical protein
MSFENKPIGDQGSRRITIPVAFAMRIAPRAQSSDFETNRTASDCAKGYADCGAAVRHCGNNLQHNSVALVSPSR